MRRWLVTMVALLAACASGRGTVPAPDAEDPPPPPPPAVEVDVSGVNRATEILDEGDLAAASQLADSVLDLWVELGRLEAGPVEDLVDLLDSVGEEYDAARLLVRTRPDPDGGERSRLRELCEMLSIAELEVLWIDSPTPGPARALVGGELARALALAGRTARAAELAASVLESEPDGADRRKAERVLDGEVEPLVDPIRIGVVLPGSGRFAAVGEQLLEGVLLAVEARRRMAPDLREVELVVRDDSSSVEAAVRLVEGLEEADVVAVLGPIRTEALASVAARRAQDDLLVISPTAGGGQGTGLNVYTAWDRRRRDSDVASALAEWMTEEMALRTFGILHPAGQGLEAVESVREIVGKVGGEVLSVQSYAPRETTFEGPISELAAAEPDAVIVLSDRPRTVLQMAPQLVYYGLRRWVTAGDANWADPSVTRRLDASYADYRLVGTYVDRVSPATAWQEFENLYEAEYRKSLPDNMFAALGFDAMGLILSGVPEAGVERRGAVGRALRRADPFHGATGDLRVDPDTGELGRDVFVRVLLDGELVDPDPEAMLEWAEEQRELEDFLKALEEEEEAGERDRGAARGEGGRR